MSNPGPAITSTSNKINQPESVDGDQMGLTSTSLISFWGAVPVAQTSPSANVHTVAAGSTTSVFVNTTFDGSIGSTAYTVGDIVAALKTVGLLKS